MTDFLTPKTRAGRRLLDELVSVPGPDERSVVDAVRWDTREVMAAHICRIEEEAEEMMLRLVYRLDSPPDLLTSD